MFRFRSVSLMARFIHRVLFSIHTSKKSARTFSNTHIHSKKKQTTRRKMYNCLVGVGISINKGRAYGLIIFTAIYICKKKKKRTYLIHKVLSVRKIYRSSFNSKSLSNDQLIILRFSLLCARYTRSMSIDTTYTNSIQCI